MLLGGLVAGAVLAADVCTDALVTLAPPRSPSHSPPPRGTPSTVNTPHTGAIPIAGPSGASSMGLPGAGPEAPRAPANGGRKDR